MSLATNVSNLATAVATKLKETRTWVNGNAADLSALNTTAKSNLVAAINEVKASTSSAAGINDTTASTSSTYSSSKTDSQIATASTADRARANHTGTQAATTITGLATVATSGSYSDLSNPPTIPAINDTTASTTTTYSSSKTDSQISAAGTNDRARANHTGTQAATTITGLATVATSGSYNDLSNKPTIPAINDTTASSTSTYSSSKTDSQISAASTNDRARANHTGTQSADTVVDGTTNKAYTATEKTKLSGIATGATANSTDAYLLARANHTGTQAASTITGLATVATSGSYADLSSKPTIPSTYSQLSGTVPQSALPAVALTDYLTPAPASQTAMLALVGQRGDWTTRTDRGTDWQLIADDPTQLSSWREMSYPASPVSSVNGRTGAVTGLAEYTDMGDPNTDFVAVFNAGLAA